MDLCNTIDDFVIALEEDALTLQNHVALPGWILEIGMLEIGDQTLELHMTGGHTADGMAVFAPWCGVLVLGDYVSPAEIPSLSSGGSLSGYRSTLSRLVELVERAEFIVPGHGAVLDVTRAISIIDEDIAYLDALEADGVDAQLPLARRSAQQLQVHADNAAAVGERG